MNTDAASFSTIVRQMTEMSHCPKFPNKKMTEMSPRKRKQQRRLLFTCTLINYCRELSPQKL